MNAELEIAGPHLTGLQAGAVILAYLAVGMVVIGLLCRFTDWRFNDDGDEKVALGTCVLFWPLVLGFWIMYAVILGICAITQAIAGQDS